MRISVASDHAGFRLKLSIIPFLTEAGHEVIDLGTGSEDPVDYPDFAAAIASSILGGEAERGILVCGSGVGAAVAANKFPGIRAGLCHDSFSARQGVEDDDANVLCLGARVIGAELAKDLVRHFIDSRYKKLPRFERRLRKIEAIEKEAWKTLFTEP